MRVPIHAMSAWRLRLDGLRSAAASTTFMARSRAASVSGTRAPLGMVVNQFPRARASSWANLGSAGLARTALAEFSRARPNAEPDSPLRPTWDRRYPRLLHVEARSSRERSSAGLAATSASRMARARS